MKGRHTVRPITRKVLNLSTKFKYFCFYFQYISKLELFVSIEIDLRIVTFKQYDKTLSKMDKIDDNNLSTSSDLHFKLYLNLLKPLHWSDLSINRTIKQIRKTVENGFRQNFFFFMFNNSLKCFSFTIIVCI